MRTMNETAKVRRLLQGENVGNLLNESQYAVLYLRYIDGLKWAYIAKKTGYSGKHVYKIHNAALRRLGVQL